MVASTMLYYLCKPQELHYMKSIIPQYRKSECIPQDHCPVLCLFYSIYQWKMNCVFQCVANWIWNKQVFITRFLLDGMRSGHWICKLSLKKILWGGQHIMLYLSVSYSIGLHSTYVSSTFYICIFIHLLKIFWLLLLRVLGSKEFIDSLGMLFWFHIDQKNECQ